MLNYVLLLCIILITIVYPQDKKCNTLIKTIGLIERMDINNLDLPIENNGSTGDNGRAYYPNGQTSLSPLFQGGFMITSYINGELRSSSMALSSLINEWQPGKWGMDPNDPLAKFYVVNSTDLQGSQAYIDWAMAVNLGADFQDLNGDGYYDPYIDNPDILGNRIIWCQISDSTSFTQRSPFLQTLPIGLEMHISVWTDARTDELGDIIYFRYRLLNATDTLKNDVIFSIWADPDIGDASDDLVGCDTVLSLGYVYNHLDDPNYGSDPPAFGIQLLQGPIVTSIGDTAYNFMGSYFGIDTLYDKKNISMQSFMWYISGSPIIPNPSNVQIARYYQIGGLDGNGLPLDPPYWGTGGTYNTNRSFAFSGDPVSGTGWICNIPDDQRIIASFGNFELNPNETKDIIIAYICAQGNNSLESVTQLKQRAAILKGLYPISRINNNISKNPIGYRLFQNYPNPFNSKTIINYALPKSTEVIFEIFNIKGQKIKTIINNHTSTGIHYIEFPAEDLPSGIYIYKINAGKFQQSKKMILLK